jgi:predicted aspartyl protease
LGGNQCGPGAAVTLPVRLVGRLPVVTVVVNDRAANLVFDTGSSATVVSEAAATILGVARLSGPPVSFNVVGGRQDARAGVIDHLRMGSIILSSVPVTITPDTQLDGVLGLDVLARYDLDVNLPMGEMVLHQGGLCPDQTPTLGGDVLQIPSARLLQAADARLRLPYLLIPVSLDGARTMGMLDTGAELSTVSTAFAGKAGVDEARLSTDRSITLAGFGSFAQARQHRFTELLVGRERFDFPELLVGGDPSLVFPVILGFDYFINHRVWFNFAADRIFVVPLLPPPAR